MTIIVHTTRHQVLLLQQQLGTLSYDQRGEQVLNVPRWLQILLVHSRPATFAEISK